MMLLCEHLFCEAKLFHIKWHIWFLKKHSQPLLHFVFLRLCLLDTTGIDLSKILGGQRHPKLLGGQKVVKSDKCMGVSQLLSTPMLDA